MGHTQQLECASSTNPANVECWSVLNHISHDLKYYPKTLCVVAGRDDKFRQQWPPGASQHRLGALPNGQEGSPARSPGSRGSLLAAAGLQGAAGPSGGRQSQKSCKMAAQHTFQRARTIIMNNYTE